MTHSDDKDIELPLLPKKRSLSRKNLPQDAYLDIETSKKSTSKSKLPYDPERYAGRPSFFRWITFTDVLPYVLRLNNTDKPFELSDIPKPEFRNNVEFKTQELEENWTHELNQEAPSFMKALTKAFKSEIIMSVILIFIDGATKLYYSIYVGDIVRMISEPGEISSKSADLLFSAFILTLLVATSVVAKNWALYSIHTNLARARLAITGLLYKKLHATSLTSLHEIKLGKVINLISNDLNDMSSLQSFGQMSINPPLILLGTYLMWGYFGAACLVGMGLSVGVVALQIKFSSMTHEPRKENKKMTDERVKITHEVVEGIRLIKMYTWEKLFKQKILNCRETEEKTFIRMMHIDALSRNISSTSIYVNILIVCIVYTIFGGVLSPDKIYASMLILLYVGANLVHANTGRMGLVNFKMVTQRVQEVLTVKEIAAVKENPYNDGRSYKENPVPVVFQNFTGYWSKGAQKPALSDINLVFKPGHVTAIIGKIGAGKSTLLFSMLKELPITSGTLEYSGKIAYVEQDPIIFSGTVRENVLFGREFDEMFYRQVIRSCNLERDLELFTHGDGTLTLCGQNISRVMRSTKFLFLEGKIRDEFRNLDSSDRKGLIGEKGVNLSGGQKARVSLARALYSQSDIYLLDDPFSALDSRVSRDIFDKVLKGSLLREKVVILVTHHLHFAKESDHVILMNDGCVELQGSFAELERSNSSLLNVFKIESQKKASEEVEKQASEHEKKKSEKALNKGEEKQTKEEAVQVIWDTYRKYLTVKGETLRFIFLGLLFVCPHVITVLFTRMLGVWAEDHLKYSEEGDKGESFSHSYYVMMLSFMLLFMLVVGFVKITQTYGFLINSNTEVHQRMLNALMRAKTLFFDINPSGRILNRFSNDLGILDKGLPRQFFEFFDQSISNMSVLITICLINSRSAKQKKSDTSVSPSTEEN